ncbi:efflux transporter, RND family, MFP subunit [Denitrovibrio acetiphilus DSM 12809]|uniref:Efflux transporter, RND family, MFP subunit n=1 Tax=Denitrovibrio acetiphilus (strain DSM 12809 / NBRC 114555 / N2460) TaxID=522772 RepID=D4H2H2_DENA2|nr:efflux RND transporter periplasmic adaptor subunit [Denitrovibrio acetiphilus]ADD67033.1 efflux transporter, RND family, MFP subunit [Denitrovibrio acetiphilus DSM 12809]
MKLKLFAGIIAVVLVAAGGYYYLHATGAEKGAQTEAQQSQQRPATPVDVYTVRAQDLSVSKDLSGRTSSFRIAEIRPQVSGIIKERLFTEGSVVQKGDQLYQIDPDTYEAALASANASLMQAEASLLAAKPKAERYAELVKVGGVSQQEFDDAKAASKQAEASVAVAKAAVKTARINLEYTKVFSPISGRIGKSSVTEGALVTANQTAALATIQNLDQIYVDVNQSSSEVRRLKTAMAASAVKPSVKLYIEGDTEPYAYEGDFQFTDITVDETTGMVNLRILFPNPEMDLLPGLFVKARVSQEVIKGAILVPQRSVMRNPNGSVYVWVAGADNKVEVRNIEIADAYEDKWIVQNGIKDGDRVLVNGFQKTGPGAVVSPTEVTSN